MTRLVLFVCLFAPAVLFGQANPCTQFDLFLKEARLLKQHGPPREALLKYNALLNCDPVRAREMKITADMLEIFQQIRDEQEKARMNAEAAQKAAREFQQKLSTLNTALAKAYRAKATKAYKTRDYHTAQEFSSKALEADQSILLPDELMPKNLSRYFSMIEITGELFLRNKAFEYYYDKGNRRFQSVSKVSNKVVETWNGLLKEPSRYEIKNSDHVPAGHFIVLQQKQVDSLCRIVILRAGEYTSDTLITLENILRKADGSTFVENSRYEATFLYVESDVHMGDKVRFFTLTVFSIETGDTITIRNAYDFDRYYNKVVVKHLENGEYCESAYDPDTMRPISRTCSRIKQGNSLPDTDAEGHALIFFDENGYKVSTEGEVPAGVLIRDGNVWDVRKYPSQVSIGRWENPGFDFFSFHSAASQLSANVTKNVLLVQCLDSLYLFESPSLDLIKSWNRVGNYDFMKENNALAVYQYFSDTTFNTHLDIWSPDQNFSNRFKDVDYCLEYFLKQGDKTYVLLAFKPDTEKKKKLILMDMKTADFIHQWDDFYNFFATNYSAYLLEYKDTSTLLGKSTDYISFDSALQIVRLENTEIAAIQSGSTFLAHEVFGDTSYQKMALYIMKNSLPEYLGVFHPPADYDLEDAKFSVISDRLMVVEYPNQEAEYFSDCFFYQLPDLMLSDSTSRVFGSVSYFGRDLLRIEYIDKPTVLYDFVRRQWVDHEWTSFLDGSGFVNNLPLIKIFAPSSPYQYMDILSYPDYQFKETFKGAEVDCIPFGQNMAAVYTDLNEENFSFKLQVYLLPEFKKITTVKLTGNFFVGEFYKTPWFFLDTLPMIDEKENKILKTPLETGLLRYNDLAIYVSLRNEQTGYDVTLYGLPDFREYKHWTGVERIDFPAPDLISITYLSKKCGEEYDYRAGRIKEPCTEYQTAEEIALKKPKPSRIVLDESKKYQLIERKTPVLKYYIHEREDAAPPGWVDNGYEDTSPSQKETDDPLVHIDNYGTRYDGRWEFKSEIQLISKPGGALLKTWADVQLRRFQPDDRYVILKSAPKKAADVDTLIFLDRENNFSETREFLRPYPGMPADSNLLFFLTDARGSTLQTHTLHIYNTHTKQKVLDLMPPLESVVEAEVIRKNLLIVAHHPDLVKNIVKFAVYDLQTGKKLLAQDLIISIPGNYNREYWHPVGQNHIWLKRKDELLIFSLDSLKVRYRYSNSVPLEESTVSLQEGYLPQVITYEKIDSTGLMKADLFDGDSMNRIVAHFENVTSARQIGDLLMIITKAARQARERNTLYMYSLHTTQLLGQWNGVDYYDIWASASGRQSLFLQTNRRACTQDTLKMEGLLGSTCFDMIFIPDIRNLSDTLFRRCAINLPDKTVDGIFSYPASTDRMAYELIDFKNKKWLGPWYFQPDRISLDKDPYKKIYPYQHLTDSTFFIKHDLTDSTFSLTMFESRTFRKISDYQRIRSSMVFKSYDAVGLMIDHSDTKKVRPYTFEMRSIADGRLLDSIELAYPLEVTSGGHSDWYQPSTSTYNYNIDLSDENIKERMAFFWDDRLYWLPDYPEGNLVEEKTTDEDYSTTEKFIYLCDNMPYVVFAEERHSYDDDPGLTFEIYNLKEAKKEMTRKYQGKYDGFHIDEEGCAIVVEIDSESKLNKKYSLKQ